MSQSIDIFDEEVYNSFTCDIPKLRYSGIQYVLDSFGFSYGIKGEIPLTWGKEVRQEFPAYRTDTAKFFLLKNTTKDDRLYPSYPVFSSREKMIPNDLKNKFTRKKPLPIKGRLIRVGLKGLTAIDRYLLNGFNFRRVKMNLVCISDKEPNTTPREITGWVYVANDSRLFKYDPHKKSWEHSSPETKTLTAAQISKSVYDKESMYDSLTYTTTKK